MLRSEGAGRVTRACGQKAQGVLLVSRVHLTVAFPFTLLVPISTCTS